MPQPSNTDIRKDIGMLIERVEQNHSYNVKEFEDIKKRQDYTNGQVQDNKRRLDERDIAERAISRYKDKNPTIKQAETVNIGLADAKTKFFLAVAGLATAVSVYIAAKGGI